MLVEVRQTGLMAREMSSSRRAGARAGRAAEEETPGTRCRPEWTTGGTAAGRRTSSERCANGRVGEWALEMEQWQRVRVGIFGGGEGGTSPSPVHFAVDPSLAEEADEDCVHVKVIIIVACRPPPPARRSLLTTAVTTRTARSP